MVASRQLLSDYLNEWYKSYYIPNHEQTSYKRAERIIRNNILPYIGHIPLSELTTDHVQTFYNLLLEKGKVSRKQGVESRSELSPRTVKYVHTILNQALSHAVKRDRIFENPCADAIPPKDKKKAKDKWVVLEAEQLKEYLADEKVMNHRDFALIHTAAYSGARQSELLGLPKTNILWNKSAIKIEKSLHVDEDAEDGFEYKDSTKNETSERTVKLSKKAMQVLKEHIEKQEAAGIESDLVFTEPDGRPIAKNNLGSRYRKLAKACGYEGMTFHHLRHAHATILLKGGAYIVAVSKRLGHASPNITLSTYAHWIPQDDFTLVEKFDELLE